jgi:hypothetical protein
METPAHRNIIVGLLRHLSVGCFLSSGVTSTGERYSPLIKYTLARLIKGLSSGRQARLRLRRFSGLSSASSAF